jgi:hypothetical protein
MSYELLERLKAEDFAVSVGFLLPPRALRSQLHARSEVQDVSAALANGGLKEHAVREFVTSLLAGLCNGERFPHDLTLAALAVALEARPTEFAREYLQDLADLDVAEMSSSIHVARECLKQRAALTKDQKSAV